MPRRKRGRPVTGWMIIDKPSGVGSTEVVTAARRALDAQKAGHAGTLDPLATGVLAIAFGEATKTVGFAMDALKTYRFTVRWGAATDTDDSEGAVVATADTRPTRAEIEAALGAFQGEILQRPPAYSAIKVDGARAYDLARDGAPPALEARPIWVERLTLIEASGADAATFDMVCGKGGYVRAIARDLGAALGCLGHVAALRRTQAGPFTLAHAIPFDSVRELSDREAAEKSLLPLTTALDDIPALAVDAAGAAHLRQGRAVPIVGALAANAPSYGETAWASHAGDAVAVGVVKGGLLHPTRVFNV